MRRRPTRRRSTLRRPPRAFSSVGGPASMSPVSGSICRHRGQVRGRRESTPHRRFRVAVRRDPRPRPTVAARSSPCSASRPRWPCRARSVSRPGGWSPSPQVPSRHSSWCPSSPREGTVTALGSDWRRPRRRKAPAHRYVRPLCRLPDGPMASRPSRLLSIGPMRAARPERPPGRMAVPGSRRRRRRPRRRTRRPRRAPPRLPVGGTPSRSHCRPISARPRPPAPFVPSSSVSPGRGPRGGCRSPNSSLVRKSRPRCCWTPRSRARRRPSAVTTPETRPTTASTGAPSATPEPPHDRPRHGLRGPGRRASSRAGRAADMGWSACYRLGRSPPAG